MLSPGDFFRTVPRGKLQNARFRQRVLTEAGRSRSLQADLREACKRDILFYVNTFGWTFDPRLKASKSIPFTTYPFQDKALLAILSAIEDGADLVIQKSRDMGASWMSLVVMEWLWHFHRDYTFLMISAKEDKVDSPGDPDSLFWKIDLWHKMLPDWLMPRGWDRRTCRRKLHFENPEFGGTIDGEATTGKASIGGRRSAIFIDEFSLIEEGQSLLSGTADVTTCRIFNFTPRGTNNASHRLALRSDVRQLRLHWRDHPEKSRGLYQWNRGSNRLDVFDKSWAFPADYQFKRDGKLRSVAYDSEEARRGSPQEMAVMWDIDYQGSNYQFFNDATIRDLIEQYAADPRSRYTVSADMDTAALLGLDRHDKGDVLVWCRMDAHGKPPVKDRMYVAAADLSWGTGASNSCFTIADAETGEKVLEYATPHVRPEEFAVQCVALCRLFVNRAGEPAYLVWEKNGPGGTFGKKVLELGYSNVYLRVAEHDRFANKATIPGFASSNQTKPPLLEGYRSALGAREFLNPSKTALEECLEYVQKEKTIEHSRAKGGVDPTGAGESHGDRVIADALANKMIREKYGGIAAKEEKAVPEPTVVPGSLQWRHNLWDQQKKQEEAWI